MRHTLFAALLLPFAIFAAPAPVPAPVPASTIRTGEFHSALTRLGTQVTYTNGTFNGSIPLSNLVSDQPGWGPIINPPMLGEYHIKMALPVDIQGVALWQHKRPGTMQQIKAFDIYVDGRLVKENIVIPLEATQVETRFDIDGEVGQEVILKIRELYPQKSQENNWGGFDRVRIFSTVDLGNLMNAPDSYKVTAEDSTVLPSAAWTAPKTYTIVKEVTGHPCLQWDAEELADMRKELADNPEMQKQLDAAKSLVAPLLKNGVAIPAALKNDEGQFVHVSDQRQMDSGETWGRIHNNLSVNCQTAALLWQLTQDKSYANLAKSILLEYAKVYPDYQVGARPGFNHDPAKVFDQCLSDATWLIPLARAYDMVYDQFTDEERSLVTKKVLKDNARFLTRNRSHLTSNTNWAAICTAAILLTGYATDDEELVDYAANGWKDAKGKRSGGYPQQFKTGIGDDMLWKEGAMCYQGMAMQALVTMAETLRHHGINMYAANDGSLKKLFDSQLVFSYPIYISPAIHDSGAVSIFNWNDSAWEYAYDNYRDEHYLPVLAGITRWLPTRFQIFVSSTKYHRPQVGKLSAQPLSSMNFNSVGYAVLRLNGGDPFLLLDYGIHGSHSHPDKLNLDFFVHGEQFAADPGSTWYEKREYKEWFCRSFAHNLLIVDEQDQIPSKGDLLVFDGDNQTQVARAICSGAVSGVFQDRAVFLTSNYLVDVFGAFAKLDHTYDLVYHLRGDAMLPKDFTSQPINSVNPGYCVLSDSKAFVGKNGLQASFTSKGQNFSRLEHNKMTEFTTGTPGQVIRMLVPEGTETQYVTGHGLQAPDTPTTLFQRRLASSTIFCTVFDISGKNHVKSVKFHNISDNNYAWIELVTADGTETFIVNYAKQEISINNHKTSKLVDYWR